MALIVSEFFQIIGVDLDYLSTSATWVDVMQYQMVIYVGVALVTGVFRMVGKLAGVLLSWREW